MNKMRIIIIAFSISLVCTTLFADNEVNKLFSTQLPRIEIEANVGFIWVVQLEGILNINDNIYGKYRMSETFLASEKSILLGYQYSKDNKNRIQLGLGYTRAVLYSFGSYGGSDASDTNVYLSTGTIEAKFIHYFNVNLFRFGLNLGANLIMGFPGVIPSFNVGLNLGAF
jgi:hypothetical protein